MHVDVKLLVVKVIAVNASLPRAIRMLTCLEQCSASLKTRLNSKSADVI